MDRKISPGTRTASLTPAQLDALPVGTVLREVHGDGAFDLVRDAGGWRYNNRSVRPDLKLTPDSYAVFFIPSWDEAFDCATKSARLTMDNARLLVVCTDLVEAWDDERNTAGREEASLPMQGVMLEMRKALHGRPPVLPSPPMPRGGARPGAGRKPATPGAPLKVRQGVPLSEEEWERVKSYAEAHGLTKGAALRRLVLSGLNL